MDKIFKIYKNKSGNVFAEYAILIGIVLSAMVAMDTYIKRNIQGKVKDLTDFIIYKEPPASPGAPPSSSAGSSLTTSSAKLNSSVEYTGKQSSSLISSPGIVISSSEATVSATTGYSPTGIVEKQDASGSAQSAEGANVPQHNRENPYLPPVGNEVSGRIPKDQNMLGNGVTTINIDHVLEDVRDRSISYHGSQ